MKNKNISGLINSVVTALLMASVCLSSQIALAGVDVTLPNGYANLTVNDLRVQSLGGELKWMRVWDGREWKFNPHWESLSQSWRNMTGSQSADTTGSIQGSSGGSGTGGDCWVTVDEDWSPSVDTTIVNGIFASKPLIPVRSTPFNRGMETPNNDYPAAQRVSVDFATLCAGSSAMQVDAEGLRRLNGLYLGENGRLSFNNRTLIEKRSVRGYKAVSSTLVGGDTTISPVIEDIPKGWRWSDKNGAWIDYDTSGRIVAFGDANNNPVWLQRDDKGVLLSVHDANGRLVYSLRYQGDLLVEVRDYSDSSNSLDLPARSIKYAYDSNNRLSQVTDVRGNITRYDYDIGNRLVKITDPEGRAEQFAYNGDMVKQRTAPDGGITDYTFEYDDTNKQFISKVTGPSTESGRRVDDYTHNRVGQLVRHIVNGVTFEEVRYDTGSRTEISTNARGFTTKRTRNEFDQTTQIVNPDGSSFLRSYSAQNLQVTEETDELGVKTQYQYDGKGNLLKKIEAAGLPEQRVTDYVINAYGQTARTTRRGRTEANGTVTQDATWQIEYDALGQISQTTDPEGSVRHYIYDRAGNLARYTDPLGHATRYEADAAGNLTKVTDALGRIRSYQYDKVGNLTSATDARGKATLIAYDAMNRRLQITNPVGGTQKVQYNGQGLPVNTTDEDGRSSQAAFDNFQLLAKQTDALGNTTEYSYQIIDGSSNGTVGSLFNPTEIKYPTFTQRQKYNQRELPASETVLNPNSQGTEGLVSSTEYDKRGQVKSTTDANGKTRFYVYDALGQLIETTDSLGNKTLATYDARGNLIQITDANGKVNKFEFDRNNRIIRETLPLGQTTEYQYDDAGNPKQRIDANGNKTNYTFDVVNRLAELKQYKGGSTLARTTTYAWDAEDNLTSWSDSDHSRNQTTSVSVTYDDANRKTGEITTYPGGNTLSYGYTYSAAGNKTRLVWADGTLIDYGYSQHGELESITIPGEGTISVNQFKWVAPAKITLPGGSTQELTFDGLLQLEGFKVKTPGQQTVLNVANTYGKVQELKTSNRTDTAGNLSTTNSSSYVYDNETRLTQATTDTGGLFGTDTESFTLDAMGNRIAHSKVSGAWTYDANNRLIQRGTGSNAIAYEYDEAGNLTKKSEPGNKITQFSYDTQNRLIEVNDGSNNLVARYGYDPLDRRLWKEQFRDKEGNVLSQAKRTLYLYSDEGLIAEASQDITLNTDQTVTTSSDSAITTQYGPRPDADFTTGMLFIKTKNSNNQDVIAYYHPDQIGTPIQATDKMGNVVWAASYNTFGKASITTPTATADKPTIRSNLRLPGQIEDSETGLHYNYRRYYDPETGRYITQDPVGLEGGDNRYRYAEANPVNYTDPTGEIVPAVVVAVAEAYAMCVAECGVITVVENTVTQECNNFGNIAKECAKDCALTLGVGWAAKKAWKWGLKGASKAWDAIKDASNGICPVSPNSFSADTLVHVRPKISKPKDAQLAKSELKPISQLQVGDEVLAHSEWKTKGRVAKRDERLSYEKVTDVFTSNKPQTLVHLTLDTGETLTATEGHPFKTSEGWRDAVMLKKSGKLLLKGGEGDSDAERTATITDIRTEQKVLPVFNLEVANAHTYFVGVDGELVHNGRCTPAMRRAWEKLHGREWPKNPLTEKIRPGGNQDGHHIVPVSKGGHKTDPENIMPLTPSQHMDWHKKNGYR